VNVLTLQYLKETQPNWEIISPDLDRVIAELNARTEAARQPIPELEALMREGFKPFPYQNEGIRFLCNTKTTYIDLPGGHGINGDEMGLGKTLQILGYLALNPQRALIICPKSVRRNWVNESQKFFKDGVFRAIEITSKTDIGEADYLHTYNLVSINYEAIKKWKEILIREGFDCEVIDESHRIKNPKAAVTKNVHEIGASTKRHILMSGTAVKNKGHELYTQVSLVDKTIFTSREDLQGHTYGEINDKIRPIFLARLKRDVFKDMPEKIRSVIEAPSEGKRYPDLIKGMEIGEISTMRTQLAIAKTEATIEFVQDILEDSDSKVIIFSDSSQAAEILFEKFGADIAVIHTGATQEDADRHQLWWRTGLDRDPADVPLRSNVPRLLDQPEIRLRLQGPEDRRLPEASHQAIWRGERPDPGAHRLCVRRQGFICLQRRLLPLRRNRFD